MLDRCRTASYSAIAALTEAFREASWPCMGIAAVVVQRSRARRPTPFSSEPTTMAVGMVRSVAVYSVSAISVIFAV